MARIENTTIYPIKSPISVNDFVIGSDSQSSNRTKNFKVSDLVGFLETFGLQNVLVTGEIVWTTGLSFLTNTLAYVINNNTFSASATTITFAAADATNPRIDLITANTSGVIAVQTGVAAATPIEPLVADPTTTIKLTAVTIAATATVPTGISKALVYDENVGTGGGEYNVTSAIGSTATINLASTANPNTGTISISITNSSPSGDVITFDKAASLNVSTFSNLHFYVFTTDQWTTASQRIKVAFFNGTTQVSSFVSVSTGRHGFSGSTVGAYQSVVIPQTDFEFSSTTYTKIVFEMENLPSGVIYIDTFNSLTGIENPPRIGSWTALINTPDSFLGEAGKVPTVRTNESGLDFVTQASLVGSLQAVTAVSKTTNLGITMTVGENTELVLIASSSVNETSTLNQGSMRMVNTNITNNKEFSFVTGSGIPNRIRSIGTAATSTGFVTLLDFPNASAARTLAFPDESGTILTNATTGVFVDLTTNQTKAGLLSFVNSTGTNTNGLDLTNSSSTAASRALHITNSNTQIGAIIINSSTGTGMVTNNTSSGFGNFINNNSTGTGEWLDNTSTGTGLLVTNTLTGTGININSATGSTGSAFKIQRNAVNTVTIDGDGVAVFATVNTGGFTVATLPTGVVGARAYVTDATAPTYGATAVGGGAVTIPVFYDGTNWITA